MERNDFDKVLRDRLEGVTEAAPDVWEGIERGLARRHRRVVMRRFSFGAVAAAACLAIALLVFRNPQADSRVSAPSLQAHLQEVSAPDFHALEVAPIREQIAGFTKNRVTARAEVTKPSTLTDPVNAADPVTAADPVVVTEPVVATDPASVEGTDPSDGRQLLTEDDLPADFWTNEETASRNHKTHTSQISILSNLTTVGSDGDLIYKASPMHSSSQTGNRASSAVEPFSESPKFFSPLSVGLQFEFPLAKRVSLSTGLTYSYLVSQYDMLVDKVLFENAYNQLHYVGIPLTLSYKFVETRSFGFYGLTGAAVEKCVSQRYVYGSNVLYEKVGGLQWSARVGMGAEYWFIPRLGLYLDPSLVYYFDNSQPFSIRTQQPLQARFEVGLRFKI